MAGSRLFPNHQRTPSLRGSLIRYYSNGQWLLRAWPRKTGTPKSLKIRNQNNWFRGAVQMAKRVPAPYLASAKQMALDTGLYPKDPIMASMAGNLYEVVLEDGTTIPKWIPKVHKAVFTGCRLRLTTPVALVAGVLTPVPWSFVDIDTSGFFDAAEPTRISIPTGVNVIQLHFQVWTVDTVNTANQIFIRDAGGNALAGYQSGGTPLLKIPISTGPIATAPGLWYEAEIITFENRNLLSGVLTHFSVDVLDTS